MSKAPHEKLSSPCNILVIAPNGDNLYTFPASTLVSTQNDTRARLGWTVTPQASRWCIVFLNDSSRLKVLTRTHYILKLLMAVRFSIKEET